MRTVSCIIGGNSSGKIWALRQQCLHYEQLLRRLSTNSAINRGIRRGKSSSFRGEGSSQIDSNGWSGGEKGISRRDGGFQSDRSDRPEWKSNSFRGNGRSQIGHGDGSRAKGDISRRDGPSYVVDRGANLRGERIVSRRDHRLQSHSGDRSGRESSFSRRDGHSPIGHSGRRGGEDSISKRGDRGEGYSRNGTGKKSTSQHQEAGKSHRCMGRGNVANRIRKTRASPEDDNTLDRKRPTSWWDDKSSSFQSSRTGNDIHPTRHHFMEASKAGHRSHQSVEVNDSLQDEELAVSKASLRSRKPALSIPYTTPASEFLYGTSVVTSALKSKRRKLYKLYVHESSGHYGGLASQEATDRLAIARKLALTAGVEVVPVNSDSLPLMDKMSDGRPHNVRPKLFPSRESH